MSHPHPDFDDSKTPRDSVATRVSRLRGSDPVARALQTDPLGVAEEITGEPYGGNMGLLISLEHAQAKEAILRAADDTYSSMSYAEFVRVIGGAGFVEAQTREFLYDRYETAETLKHCVYVHPLGMTLLFTTWMGSEGEKINAAHVYYNWRPSLDYCEAFEERKRLLSEPQTPAVEDALDKINQKLSETSPYAVLSTSSWVNADPSVPDRVPNPAYDPSYDIDGEHYDPAIPYDDPRRMVTIPNPAFRQHQMVCVGYHDAREGLVHKLRQLFARGDFLTPWVEVPHGLHTFDLVESRAYYGHSLYPHEDNDARAIFQSLSREDRQRVRTEHSLEAYAMVMDDIERWPQALRAIIGEQAIARKIEDERKRPGLL